MTADELRAMIRIAFADVHCPGQGNLRGSSLGDEPYLLEAEFSDKRDWRGLDPAFLDQAPDGYASALSFFSDVAFRFFLPAYLIADIDGALQEVDVPFHLWHGTDNKMRDRRVNPNFYGDTTWFEIKSKKFDGFSLEQAKAIVAYLQYKLEDPDSFNHREIKESLENYWLPRLNRPEPTPPRKRPKKTKRSRGEWEKESEDLL